MDLYFTRNGRIIIRDAKYGGFSPIEDMIVIAMHVRTLEGLYKASI